MKEFCVLKMIGKDLHKLYQIMPDEDWSEGHKYPWRIAYESAPHAWLSIPENERHDLYWLPIEHEIDRTHEAKK
jgi:hypothetical protein